MKRFEKLINLTLYLSRFQPKVFKGKPILVVNGGKATSRLANRSGTQIVIALPEEHQQGNTDRFSSSLGTVIYVLEKEMASERTDSLEREQYNRLLDLAVEIMADIEGDASTPCNEFLQGLSLVNVGIVPEASIFGSWCGYSVEITFE